MHLKAVSSALSVAWRYKSTCLCVRVYESCLMLIKAYLCETCMHAFARARENKDSGIHISLSLSLFFFFPSPLSFFSPHIHTCILIFMIPMLRLESFFLPSPFFRIFFWMLTTPLKLCDRFTILNGFLGMCLFISLQSLFQNYSYIINNTHIKCPNIAI